MMFDELLNEPFHGCAFAAFVEVCRETETFPPDSEAVRQRAYRYYEEELAARSGSATS